MTLFVLTHPILCFVVVFVVTLQILAWMFFTGAAILNRDDGDDKDDLS
jgi:hypothetical protein